jgi:hypothetical protein
MERELRVSRVEVCDQVAGRDAVAFGHAQIDEIPTDLRRHLHLGGLDVSRHAHAIGRRVGSAGGQAGADKY